MDNARDDEAPASAAHGWQHPGSMPNPQTVMIVALGPTKLTLIERQTKHDPGLLPMCEIWGCNAGVNWISGRVAWDLLWVMDYLEGEAAKHPVYGRTLADWSRANGGRIMTSIAGAGQFEGLATEFPIRELWDDVRDGSHGVPYFKNSLPYMIAYAWWIGVKTLYLIGVDYSHPALGANVREAHRANAEFWIGWACSQGVEIVIPTESTLCAMNEPPDLYGYPPGAERAIQLPIGPR